MERKYDIFEPVLQKLNTTFITGDYEYSKAYKQDFINFFNIFTKKLGEIEPIYKDFGNKDYIGSVHDGTFVGKTFDEFDVNINISLSNNVIVEKSGSGYVYIRLNILDNYKKQEPYKANVFKEWIDPNNYLDRIKFSRWWVSAIDRTLDQFEEVYRKSKYVTKMDDFYFTRSYFEDVEQYIFDVEHQQNSYSETRKFQVKIMFSILLQNNIFNRKFGNSFIALPIKPNYDIGNIFWRYLFPHDESQRLWDKNHLKNVIRLIKKMCDVNCMRFMTSYYIKSFLRNEVLKRNDSFWDKSLSYVLVTVLYSLRDTLTKKVLYSVYDPEVNLFDINYFDSLSEQQLNEALKRVTAIVHNIDTFLNNNVPKRIIKIFLTQDEIDTFNKTYHSYSQPTKLYGQAFAQIQSDDGNERVYFDDDLTIISDQSRPHGRHSSEQSSLQTQEQESPGFGWGTILGGVALGIGALALYGATQSRRNNQ